MEGEMGIFSKNLDQRKFPTIHYIIGCEKAIWLNNACVQPYFHKPQTSEKIQPILVIPFCRVLCGWVYPCEIFFSHHFLLYSHAVVLPVLH